MKLQFAPRLFRETTEGEGGNPTPPTYKTLKDLEEAPEVLGTSDTDTGIESGNGEKKPVDLAAQDATGTDTGKNAVPEDAPKEELAEESEEIESGEDLDVEGFFQQVEQITGQSVKVEYGEADPLSAEGVAIREKAVRIDAEQKFDDYLRTTNPRGYAYLLHKQTGGSDEDFFSQKVQTLPDIETFKGSTDLKVQLLEKDLIDNGVPEDIAKASVAKFVKDNTLDERAEKVYDKIKQIETNQLKALEEREQQEREQFEKLATNVVSAVGKTITNGNLKFIIPESSQKAFHDHIKENIRYDNGEFYLVSKIDEDPTALLEAEYFKYVKGDLNKLIEKKAKSITTQKLKAKVREASQSKLPSSDTSTKRKDFIPLGEL